MKKLVNVLVNLSIAIGVIFVYTLIHEGAHAFFVIIFGGDLIEFDINFLTSRPHINYAAEFSNWKSAIVSIAGPVIPFFVWFAALLMSRKTKNIVIKKILLFSSIIVIFSMITNIAIPILYECGYGFYNEDIVKFISILDISGYIVSIFIGLLVIIGVKALMKTLNVKEVLESQIEITALNKKHFIWLIPILTAVVLIMIVSAINILDLKKEPYKANIPNEYSEKICIDFNKESYENTDIYTLKVDEPKLYSFYCRGVCNKNVLLKLIGNEDFSMLRNNELILVDNQGNIQSNHLGWYLNKGEYRLELTTLADNGELNIYINSEDKPYVSVYDKEEIFNNNIPDLEEGYNLIIKEPLRNFEEKEIYDLLIDKSKYIQLEIFATTRTGEAVVKLKGKNHEDILLDKYQIHTSRGMLINKGNYQITLSAKDCDGELYIYMKIRE